MSGICVISARGGSQGVKGKNIKPVLGKPLIAWSIEQALAAENIEHVVVSTDSEEIAAVARKAGALTPFIRPDHLASSDAGKFQVWQHALSACEDFFDQDFEFFLDLDCTNPLRDVEDINAAIRQFREARLRNIDAVFSISDARKNPYFNMLQVGENGGLEICKKADDGNWIVRRQDAPDVYEHVASIYVLAPDFLKSNAKNLLDGICEGYKMPAEKTYDLDSESDLELIEYFLRKRIAKTANPFVDVAGKKVALIGATGILGSYYVELLVSQGAQLVIADKPGSQVLELGKKHNIPALEIDVSKEASVVAGFKWIDENFGELNAVINNAAITSEGLAANGGDPFAPVEEADLSVWNNSIDVNLTGTFLVAREGGKILKKGNGGSIINISSIYGVVAPDHNMYTDMPFKSFAGYSASKAGVIGLTRWLASWWGKDNIRVNSIAPGGVYNNHDQTFVDRYSQKTVLGRMATPEDIAGMVLFLISDASSYCTGQNYLVDGGLSCL